MKLKSLLKPFLASAALGSGVYYYKYGKLPLNIGAGKNNLDVEKENCPRESYAHSLIVTGMVHHMFGDYNNAIKLWGKAYTISLKQVGPDHPYTANAREFLNYFEPEYLSKLEDDYNNSQIIGELNEFLHEEM